MLNEGTERLLREYCRKHPEISPMRARMERCVEMLTAAFQNGGQLLICGNGGSCADADHIVGEMVKSFRVARPLDTALSERLRAQGPRGGRLADCLQSGLPAINLAAHSALMTAMENDVGGAYIYAQQVAAYGRPGDILLGISTSGHAENVLNAGLCARAKGMRLIALTGRDGGKMNGLFDLVLCAPGGSTEEIQDTHSVVYHAICACVEYQIWGETACTQ